MQARFFRAGLRAEVTTDERKGKRRANGHTEQKRPPRGKMSGREIREEPARGTDAEELESMGADKAPRQQDPGHDPKRGHRSGRQALPRDPNGSSITGAKYSKLYLAADFAQNGEKCQEAGKRTHGAEKRNTGQSRGRNGGKFGNILQKHTCKSLLHNAADDQGQRDPGHADPIRAKCTCKSLLHNAAEQESVGADAAPTSKRAEIVRGIYGSITGSRGREIRNGSRIPENWKAERPAIEKPTCKSLLHKAAKYNLLCLYIFYKTMQQHRIILVYNKTK